jgi:hypothetical protein
MDTRFILKSASASLLKCCLHESGNASRELSCLDRLLVPLIKNFRTTPNLWTEDSLINTPRALSIEIVPKGWSKVLVVTNNQPRRELLSTTSYSVYLVINYSRPYYLVSGVSPVLTWLHFSSPDYAEDLQGRSRDFRGIGKHQKLVSIVMEGTTRTNSLLYAASVTILWPDLQNDVSN